jgi:fluoroacetyl-CoA thioesterase
MKQSLKPGITLEHTFTITSAKTVPSLYPEASEFVVMPDVFATGFLVGLLEWTCIKLINEHIDWPNEQSLGTHINVSHQAATPTGLTVTAKATLTAVEDRKLSFDVEAHDGVDLVSKGTHERFVISREKFDAKLKRKQQSALNS